MIEIEEGPWEKPEDDAAAAYQFQSVLLKAVEGERSDSLNDEYMALRRAFMNSIEYRTKVPKFIQNHRDLKSLWPFLKKISDTWEPRRETVREELRDLLEMTEKRNASDLRAASWTGILSPTDRLVFVKSLIPVAQAATETLIASLQSPKGNGAPLLDEHESAIEHLKSFHKALGEVLQLAESGLVNSDASLGMVKEMISYCKRAAKQLRDDPVPYAFSALLLAALTPLDNSLAGYMAGIAANIKRTTLKN